MLTDHDLAAIEARAKAATKGPWRIVEVSHTNGLNYEAVLYDADSVDALWRRDNREFIRAAREDIPALLDEVRRLRIYQSKLEVALSTATAFWEEHPEDWDMPCSCETCLSYGEPA